MQPHLAGRAPFALAVFFFAATVLASGIDCGAQVRPPSTGTVIPRTYYIRGTVRSSDDGRAMEMIRVDLKRLTGEVVGTTFTRSNGEFEFNGLPNGVYYVVLEEKGYEPIREAVEILNSARPGVFIFLKRPVVVSVSEPGSTVSAHELSLPHKARDAMQKGMDRLYAKQDSRGSLKHFQRAVEEVPSYYEAYMQMGVAYMRLEQTAEAEQALRKSIELSAGRYSEAYFTLAALLSNSQQFAEAEPLARRGLELDGTSWQGHYQLGRVLFGLSRLDSAEKSLEEARKRKPDFAELYLVRANIHIRRRDYPALLEDLDTYLKLDPKGPMSDQVRQTRDKVQGALANARNAPSVPGPKP